MCAKSKGENKQVRVRGLIIPANWDDKGDVTAITISTYEEEEYLIDNNEKGEQLLSLLRREVEVSGLMRKEEGNKKIKVEEFS
jgi:hypothetical protein